MNLKHFEVRGEKRARRKNRVEVHRYRKEGKVIGRTRG
jgi:hypothetical protein